MTTLTEAAENLAQVPALPVRHTDEMDPRLLDAYAAELVRHMPKDREAK
ncbi:MAG TPA: hypothetical protein VIN36_07775 [Thiobacillus sp.]